jgi:hypothetical protein
MARQELIRELQIREEEILQELRIREKKLIDELEAILKILGSNNINVSIGNSLQSEQRGKVATLGTPKGEMDWYEYVEYMLKEIGSKGKSKDVADAIIKANLNIDKSTILHAVRHNLSLLLKNNKISANKSEIKSEGYEYFIK